MRSCERKVVRDLHLRLMRIVAQAAEAAENTSVRLEGGTALAAYYLVHRESEDLDFFSDYDFDQRRFGEFVVAAGEAEGLRFSPFGARNPTMVRFRVEDPSDPGEMGVKVDLAGQSPFRLEPLEDTAEGIRITSYRDLVANKVHAACDRIEARDFIDLHAILTHELPDPANAEEEMRRRTRALVRDVMEIDPGLNVRRIGDGVARGFDKPIVTKFPLQIFIPISEADVQRTLRLFVSECAIMTAETRESGS